MIQTSGQQRPLSSLRAPIRPHTYKGESLLNVYIVVLLLLFSLSHVQLFCDPMDCSPPSSCVHGILQAGILERAAISFPRGSS